jgi:hypothetical protein
MSEWKPKERLKGQNMHGNPEMVSKRRVTKDDIVDGFENGSTAVYVFEAGPAVKVGISRDPVGRLRLIQTSQDRLVTAYWAVRLDSKHAVQVEREVHKRLSVLAAHAQGEWYYISPAHAVDAIKAIIKKLGHRSVVDLRFGYDY